MNEARWANLAYIIWSLIGHEKKIRTWDEAVFDIFDAAICTREEAQDLIGMDAKAFSLGLRARRKQREISKVWP
jgi:hypothetical protein